MDRVTRS